MAPASRLCAPTAVRQNWRASSPTQANLWRLICAAPTVLADAGLLGERFTAHFSVHAELPAALAGERVVEDGLLITSRGAGTAVDFGLALVRRLFGEAAEKDIFQAIMA